jgi:hypothetical protein
MALLLEFYMFLVRIECNVCGVGMMPYVPCLARVLLLSDKYRPHLQIVLTTQYSFRACLYRSSSDATKRADHIVAFRLAR